MERGEVVALVREELDRHRVAVLVRQLGWRIRWGAGSPEGVVVAPVGTVWLREDGGAGTTLYVKESGVDAAGWVAK